MKLLHQIKKFVRILILSFLIFFGVFVPQNMAKTGMEFFVDTDQMNLEILENSLVKINVQSHTQTGRLSGSGSLISIRNNINVITNAHVCLGPSYVDVVFNNKKNINLIFEINSKELYYSKSINASELVYNLDEDWCLIPLELENFHKPILTDKFLEDKMPKKAITMTYNRQKTVSKYDKFEACSTDPFFQIVDTNVSVCDIDPIPQQPKKLRITSNKNEEKKMKLGIHYLYQFAPIPGDSGSPVYNSQSQLVGLIVGQKRNDSNDNIIDWGYVTPLTSLKENIKNKIIYP